MTILEEAYEQAKQICWTIPKAIYYTFLERKK